MENEACVAIQVCFVTPERATITQLTVQQGTTIEQAIALSGILHTHPEINLQLCKVGIYSKIKPMETIVQALDRIELYRPLQVDPKAARRKRAQKK